MVAQSHGRTKVFISYSHKDKAWLERLHVHLRPLERDGRVEHWDDTRIKAGGRWREEIAEALTTTKVAVLLVSADFLASDFIVTEELPPLLSAAKKEGAVILPVILNHSRFMSFASLSQFQAVNDPLKPLAALKKAEPEAVFVKVSEVIENCLKNSQGAADGSGGLGGLHEASQAKIVDDEMPVTMPGVFRYFLDTCFPWLHKRLTTEIDFFEAPPEWLALNKDLDRLRERIESDIRGKTYIEPPVKDVPEDAERLKVERTEPEFFTPIQQVIKEILGVSHGGDAQSAQISAISRKSKFVRNIVKRLLKAEEPLILLGDPGMGKSFTLQQAARLIALSEGRRVFPKLCLFFSMGKFQMPALHSVWMSEDELDEKREDAVWNYVRRFTAPEVRPYLKPLAARKRLVIIFDGMDEMSRARYNDYTQALSVFAGRNKGRVKTLFSCRITDFTPTFEHYRLVLLPFTWSLIRDYLERWFGDSPIVLGNQEWTAKGLAKWLAKDTLPIQATNPFVLRLLCKYIEKEHDWPESRVHLLEYYVRSHYEEKATAARREGRSMPPVDDAFLVWGRLAYELAERNMGTEISRRNLEQFLTPEELPAVQAGKDCGVLLEAVDMEETELVEIRFEHQRFQEFFTAYYFDKNRRGASSVNWLKKLDAPRWQETLFNLVLMGGGAEALGALVKAVEHDLDRLQELKGLEKSEDTEKPNEEADKSDGTEEAAIKAMLDAERKAEAVRLETMLADRIELASRILQQMRQQLSGEGMAALLSVFQRAVNWLSEHGNPITKVKMLLAARIVPETDIWGVAQKVRASEVAWVRQQARIITWATDRKVEASELQDKDPTLTVQGELGYSFASGLFLKRFVTYLRISLGLERQHGLWLVLAMGLVLCSAQLLASYGVVAAARGAMVPAYSLTEEWANRSARRALEYLEWKANQPGFEDTDGKLLGVRRRTEDARAQFPTIINAVQKTLGSWWFLLAAHITMFMTLLVSLRQVPGQQSFTFQTGGYVCIFLPMTLHTLWLGTPGNIVLLVFFLLLYVPVVRAVGWAVTLLAHTFTLALFSASTFVWTKQGLKTTPLLASMWENAGFRSWGKSVKESLISITTFIPLIVMAVVFLTEVNWQRVRAQLSWTLGQISAPPPAVTVALKVVVFGLTCVAGLGVVTRLMPWIRQNGWRGRLRSRLKGWRGWRPRSEDVKRVLGCMGILTILGLIGWELSFIAWQSVGNYILLTFGLFPSIPLYANIALSAVIYAEAAGCLVALVAILLKGREGLKAAGGGLGIWTILCWLAALIVLAS